MSSLSPIAEMLTEYTLEPPAEVTRLPLLTFAGQHAGVTFPRSRYMGAALPNFMCLRMRFQSTGDLLSTIVSIDCPGFFLFCFLCQSTEPLES